MDTLNLNLSITTGKKTEIIDDFCSYHSYQPLINGKANPETKASFIKRKVIEYIKNSVTAWRAKTAQDTARQTKIDEVNSISID